MSPIVPQKVDALTCSFALKGCTRALAFFEATQIHSKLLRFGYETDILLLTTLLDVYAKIDDFDTTQKVFDNMCKRDIASWNAMIFGLALGSRPNEAIALFNIMKDKGRRPKEVTVLGTLLYSCTFLLLYSPPVST